MMGTDSCESLSSHLDKDESKFYGRFSLTKLMTVLLKSDEAFSHDTAAAILMNKELPDENQASGIAYFLDDRIKFKAALFRDWILYREIHYFYESPKEQQCFVLFIFDEQTGKKYYKAYKAASSLDFHKIKQLIEFSASDELGFIRLRPSSLHRRLSRQPIKLIENSSNASRTLNGISKRNINRSQELFTTNMDIPVPSSSVHAVNSTPTIINIFNGTDERQPFVHNVKLRKDRFDNYSRRKVKSLDQLIYEEKSLKRLSDSNPALDLNLQMVVSNVHSEEQHPSVIQITNQRDGSIQTKFGKEIRPQTTHHVGRSPNTSSIREHDLNRSHSLHSHPTIINLSPEGSNGTTIIENTSVYLYSYTSRLDYEKQTQKVIRLHEITSKSLPV